MALLDDSKRKWTHAGLAIALLGVPALVFGYRVLVPQTTSAVQLIARELGIFVLLFALLAIVKRGEKLPLSSIGFKPGQVGRSLAWGLLGFVLLALGVAAAFALLNVLGMKYETGAARFVAPMGVTLLTVFRAGIVEEVFYRGYAMERLETLSGSRVVAFIVPLLFFASFHYRQGFSGVLVALVLGAILAGLYRWKRDLVMVVFAHFLIDLVPNVILPLLSGP